MVTASKKCFAVVVVLAIVVTLLYVSRIDLMKPLDYSLTALIALTAAYYPRNYTSFDYLLNHPDLCSSRDPTQPLTLLILVISAPKKSKARDTVRRTWGTVARRADVQLGFLLGATVEADVQNHLEEENALYGDLIQEDFLDTFRNLTLKSLMMLRWVTDHCQLLPRHLLKIDDDCFLNPNNLLTFVGELDASKDAIYGNLQSGVLVPQRDQKSKLYVSEHEYSKSTYPNYVAGPSYLISGHAVPSLYRAAATIELLSLEDVYITGLLAMEAGVANVHVGDFGVMVQPSACTSREHITYHDVNLNEIQMLWWMANNNKLSSSCQDGHLKNADMDTILNRIIQEENFP